MKRELYVRHAEVCKTFSNPTRLELLNLLRNGGLSVSDLVNRTRLTQANVSQHLAIMRSRGVVIAKRKGPNTYYSIAKPKIIKAFDIIREALSERKGR